MLTAQSALNKDKTTKAALEHRHFAFIAATIAAMPDHAATIAAMPDHAATLRTAKRSTALMFADACKDTNPRFDRARFLRACGEES